MASAQTKPKETPPAVAPARDFQIPVVEKFTVANGLDVRLVPYGNVPKVNIGLFIRAGNENEAADQVWLADLVGQEMEQGTATRSAEQLALEGARMGGAVDVSVGANQTIVASDALSASAADMVRLIADVAINSKLPESEIARLKSDLVRQLSIARSQPRQLGFEKFMSVLYPNHSYGRVFPTESMIAGYTAAQVKRFYDENFGADRSTLYVVGRFDRRAVEIAIRDAYGSWKSGVPALEHSPSPTSRRALHLIDRPDSVQSTIYLGLPVVSPSNPDYLSVLVMNALLGGSFGSRITSNIREQKGYTYSPNSQVSVRLKAGHWVEIADVTTNVTGPSLKEIFFEIDRLRGEAPSRDELKGIQNYLAGVFVLQNSTRAGIMNLLNFVDLHGMSEDYLRSYVRNVHALSPADIQRMAQRYVDPGKTAIVIVGDQKAIREQITPYGTIAP